MDTLKPHLVQVRRNELLQLDYELVPRKRRKSKTFGNGNKALGKKTAGLGKIISLPVMD